MPLDLALFGSKVRLLREDLLRNLEDVSRDTGIAAARLAAYESGERQPTGDDILILADHFRVDYAFFVSNQRKTPFEQATKLFRAHADDLNATDRFAIQEFLFLCDAEAHLERELGRPKPKFFSFEPPAGRYQEQARAAAAAFRMHCDHSPLATIGNLYDDLRRSGFHVFRRRLQNSAISGIYMRHPSAGKCILVNYVEDVFRQNFTLAHEAAHGILDDAGEEPILSLETANDSLSERRANAFAAAYLVPRELLLAIPNSPWTPERVAEWAERLTVSPAVLVFALRSARLVSEASVETLRTARIPRGRKVDPELAAIDSERSRSRRNELLERGISTYYARLCFDAYRSGIISFERMAELFLVSQRELGDIAEAFGEGQRHEH